MALEDGREIIMFVVTPLNLLGKQNQATLEKAGLPAVAVSKENASVDICSVRESVQLAIENLRISAAMSHPRTVASSCCRAAGHGAMPGTKKMPDLELILKVVMPSDPTFHFRN